MEIWLEMIYDVLGIENPMIFAIFERITSAVKAPDGRTRQAIPSTELRALRARMDVSMRNRLDAYVLPIPMTPWDRTVDLDMLHSQQDEFLTDIVGHNPLEQIRFAGAQLAVREALLLLLYAFQGENYTAAASALSRRLVVQGGLFLQVALWQGIVDEEELLGSPQNVVAVSPRALDMALKILVQENSK